MESTMNNTIYYEMFYDEEIDLVLELIKSLGISHTFWDSVYTPKRMLEIGLILDEWKRVRDKSVSQDILVKKLESVLLLITSRVDCLAKH